VIGQSPDATPGQEVLVHRKQERRQLLLARASAMCPSGHHEARRAAPTWSEQALFRLVGAGQLGVAVRRQVVVGEFVVDLAVPAAKLAIEVDGASHAGRAAADARRDRKLARLGWRVLRVEAELVLREPEVAVERVRVALRR
jgi:very-short-patch-repair endonuclease